MGASAAGASYGDLLAPPPSYADSMMYSRPPEGFARSAAAPSPADAFSHSPSQSHAGMMRTVALDPGGGGESLGDGEPPVGPRREAARAVLSGEIVEAEDPLGGGGEKLAGGLSVSVADPQMSLAAGSPFGKKVVTYKVRVVVRDPAAFPEYKARDTAVWRRFRDFVALADLLRESHKGYFVPPRPEKKPLSLTADDAFVRDRTHQLGAYLDKLARHPACCNAAELRVFLTAPDLERDPEWLAFAARAGVSPPSAGARLPAPEVPAPGSSADADMSSSMRATAEGGAYGAAPGPGPYGGFANPNAFAAAARSPPKRGVGKFFNRLGAAAAISLQNSLAGAGPSPGGTPVAEDDAAFLEERDRVFRLEQELAIASLKAGRALECEEKFSDAMGELGLECVKLAKLEDGEAVRRGGGAYGEEVQIGRDTALRARKMGNAAVRVSRLTRAAVGALSKSLQPMHEYLSMMPAVRRAVADRGDALLEWRRSAAEVEAKKARLARLETDITKMLQVDLLKREVAEASVAAERARGEYETVKARHADEFSRLEKSRCASFKRMWLAFARTQAAHAERAVQVWRAVAEDLGASPEEWRGTERADAGEGEAPSASP
jgi:sorting nexin-1/2